GAPAIPCAPFVWVAAELGRERLFTGFPWVLLGYSQASVLPIAQFSSVLGVYGVSGLVAGVSSSLAFAALTPSNRLQLARAPSPTDRRRGAESERGRVVPVMVILALVAVIAAAGSVRVSRSDLTRTGAP